MVEMPPLPLAPGGSVRVSEGVSFFEDEPVAVLLFVWGMAAWSWKSDDEVARRLQRSSS